MIDDRLCDSMAQWTMHDWTNNNDIMWCKCNGWRM